MTRRRHQPAMKPHRTETFPPVTLAHIPRPRLPGSADLLRVHPVPIAASPLNADHLQKRARRPSLAPRSSNSRPRFTVGRFSFYRRQWRRATHSPADCLPKSTSGAGRCSPRSPMPARMF